MMSATIIPVHVQGFTTYAIGLVTGNGTALRSRISYPSNGAATNAAIDLMGHPFDERLWDLVNDITFVGKKGS